MNNIDKFRFSFRNAITGIKTAFKTQRNLRVHFIVGILVLVFSIFLRVSLIELSLLVVTIALVFIAEVFNTAIEKTVDLITPEYNKQAKIAKDIGASGVLITAVFAILIGLIIFLPKIANLIEYFYK